MQLLGIYPRKHQLDDREAAETIEAFGDDLRKLMLAFDKACNRMSPEDVERVDSVPCQDQLNTIAEDFRKLGDALRRECDAREESAS